MRQWGETARLGEAEDEREGIAESEMATDGRRWPRHEV
ncbi:hypothetical protein ZOD2009_19773 [Haladaptatus paucihalophilus DX253]|uniref:Uncharacterized protein n=1 Tax=Haladaptatus paucihalophilus DX253 TaxID=797209 RepID=E7QYR4_HALPU|nr:hypothetical protein ZOD2009_19773 [Haladaptatus paucihalophilus DX253]